MASQLNVINLGLSHIAQVPITAAQLAALTGNVQVEVALRVWEPARQEALRAANWGFAKVQEALVVLASTTFDPVVYDYAYTYPANCLAIRKVNNEVNIDDTISGLFERMYDSENIAVRIVTDIEDAYIEYTYDHDTPTLWDSAFVMAMSFYLAALMAVPLNGDGKQAEAQAKLAFNAASEAKRHDAGSRHESHDANKKSNYVDARG